MELYYNIIMKALVAQWLEQGSHKPLVAGSSPAGRTNGSVVQLAETTDLKSVQCGFESHRSYHFTKSPIAQTGESACLISVRSWVQFPLGVLFKKELYAK